MPQTDTYIAKDSAINEEIDKLRLSATAALVERKDVIVIASVSCIYGLGSPEDYLGMMVSLRPGMEKDRDEVIRALVDIQYTRNDMDRFADSKILRSLAKWQLRMIQAILYCILFKALSFVPAPGNISA